MTGTILSRLVHFVPIEPSQPLCVCACVCVERNLLLREERYICLMKVFQKIVLKKYLGVIFNHPRRSTTSNLHYILNIEPIPIIIHRLTAKFLFTPQSPGPENRKLSSSLLDKHVQEI